MVTLSKLQPYRNLMPANSFHNTVLMSIHPEYVEKIALGAKKVEFRKAFPREGVEYIVVYATAPISAVMGVIHVGDIYEDTPAKLWAHFSDVAGIDRDRLMKYYEGRKCGMAIEIKEYEPLESPLSLSEIEYAGPPPQSYAYLREEQLTGLPTFSAAFC